MRSIINSKSILILSLIAVIFLISCASSKEKKEILSTCEKITDARIKNTCLAIAEKDTPLCDKISDIQENADEKDLCYMAVALKTKNAAICEKLSTLPSDYKPYTSKFTCKALVENNSAGCDEALQKEFYGFNCFVKLAEITKNAGLCDRYTQAIGIQGVQLLECKAILEKDIAKCSKEDLPKCYFDVAILKGNSAICDSMPSAQYPVPDMQKVRDICKAVANRDVSSLDCTVELKPMTPFAESMITYKACSAIAALTEDISACDKIVIKGEWISPVPSPKDKCYLNLIMRKSGILPIETLINDLDRIWQ